MAKVEDIYAKCCLRSCKDRMRTTDGRIDARAFSVSAEERADMLAKWDDGGRATFHLNCWRRLRNIYKLKQKPQNISENVANKEKQMIDEANKTVEFHHSRDMLMSEGKRIVNMIKTSQYLVAFTGAGISTSAGIGDYRGIYGQWTERDKKKEHGNQVAGTKRKKQGQVRLVDVRPTYSHEALVKLTEMGYLKHTISQNTDGLHKLSGLKKGRLSELHGNAFVEKCENCGNRCETRHGHKLGKREPDVPPKPCPSCRIDHRTGRICPVQGCGGYMKSTIINFGDEIEDDVLECAIDNATKADMVLCLGSSLRVSPANMLLQVGDVKKRIVICNRQVTPYDCLCYELNAAGTDMNGSRVFGDCDDLMREVMRRLLPSDELHKWESKREERLQQYSCQRSDS